MSLAFLALFLEFAGFIAYNRTLPAYERVNNLLLVAFSGVILGVACISFLMTNGDTPLASLAPVTFFTLVNVTIAALILGSRLVFRRWA